MRPFCLFRSIFITLFLTIAVASLAAATDWADVYPAEETASECQEHFATPHTKLALKQEVTAFQTLAEEALSLRAVTIRMGQGFKKKVDAGETLTGADLDLLGKGLAMHLELRERLMKTALSHECWLGLSKRGMTEAGLTADTHLEGVMLSLAAALLMYDNYLYTAALFQAEPKLRFLLNRGDRGYQVNRAQLTKLTLSYNSVINRARVRYAMEFYEKAVKAHRVSAVDPYLRVLIAQSPSYDMVRKWSPFRVIGKKLGILEDLTIDSVKLLENEGVGLFSMLFGNTIGLVETRRGLLYQKTDVKKELLATLKSGDILLEKTPFRLTDKLIPGYWGHAAVWIGTEAELRELGLWSHPVVFQHRKAIREGRLIVEALRSGVEMNSLDRFLNIDSLGILRRPNLTKAQRSQIILQTLRQVGKSYDFNFDVESINRVYCSKLVYLAYHGVDWPVKRALGRATISPDDVAVRVFDKDDLQLVIFYHDGKPVKKHPASALAALMGRDLTTR